LFHLLTYFSVLNFIGTFLNVLLTPLVLNFATERGLGLMLSISGIGMLLGSVLIALGEVRGGEFLALCT
jgi:hypothetical protein